MSEGKRVSGKREAAREEFIVLRWWREHCQWVSGLTSGQRLRYRLFQLVTILAALVIAAAMVYSKWAQMPEVPIVSTRPEANMNQPGNNVSEVQPGQTQETITSPMASGRKEGVYTILVAGKDVVSGATDTMLLVSYDSKNKTLYGLNLPRDTMMNVSTSSKRLNTVFAYNRGSDKATQTQNGMAALKRAVSNLTGIYPDFYVMVEWEAIGDLVNALGGVEFNVPYLMKYDDPDQNLHIYQEPGLRLLDGDDAMQVIRHRQNNEDCEVVISAGDVGRLKVQQDFLKAVVKKCLQPAVVLKIPELVDVFTKNVETDLSVGNLVALAQSAIGMDVNTSIEFSTAPLASSFRYGPARAAMVTLDAQGILEIVNGKMNPYIEDVQLSDLELLVRRGDGSFTVTSGTLRLNG